MTGITSFVLATALITAPESAPAATYGIAKNVFMETALALELLDPRETNWFFLDFPLPSTFTCNLRTLRQRYALIHDAPPFCDIQRWPSHADLSTLMAENTAYQAWLELHRTLTHEEWTTEALKECEKLHQIYDLARNFQPRRLRSDDGDAFCIDDEGTPELADGDQWVSRPLWQRRASLAALREAIGPSLYYAGCLPPHIPVWYLKRID